MIAKRKWIALGILVLVIIALQWMWSSNEASVSIFDTYFFVPCQTIRIRLLHYIALSVGDIIYFLAGFGLLIGLIQFVFYACRFRKYKSQIFNLLFNFIIIIAAAILWFLLGWGGNYNKPGLATFWGLKHTPSRLDDSIALVNFNILLIQRLNESAPKFQHRPLRDVNAVASSAYSKLCAAVQTDGLCVKNSLYSYFIERLGIDGYYNPFTGEGQINSSLPGFMLPFVVTHEMAHQAGIAAEDDANLLAYAIGTLTDDPSFNYSAALNVWLYTSSRLRRHDSMLENKLEANLNALTRRHLDTLEMIAKEYDNGFARSSSDMYDAYLKLNRQKEGLRSYGHVSLTARLWEEQRRLMGRQALVLP